MKDKKRPLALVVLALVSASLVTPAQAVAPVLIPCQQNLFDHRILVDDRDTPAYARGQEWRSKTLHIEIKTKDQYGLWGYGVCKMQFYRTAPGRKHTAVSHKHSCATVVDTTDGFLSVREGPAVEQAEIGRVNSGDFVDVENCSTGACAGAWRQVEHVDWARDRDGAHPLRGWVNGKYLKTVDCGDEP